MHLCLAVRDLMAICGNLEKPGTHAVVHNSFEINAGYSSMELHANPDALAKKFCKKMAGFEGIDFVGMFNPDAMVLTLETNQPYPIKMFWAQERSGAKTDSGRG